MVAEAVEDFAARVPLYVWWEEGDTDALFHCRPEEKGSHSKMGEVIHSVTHAPAHGFWCISRKRRSPLQASKIKVSRVCASHKLDRNLSGWHTRPPVCMAASAWMMVWLAVGTCRRHIWSWHGAVRHPEVVANVSCGAARGRRRPLEDACDANEDSV